MAKQEFNFVVTDYTKECILIKKQIETLFDSISSTLEKHEAHTIADTFAKKFEPLLVEISSHWRDVMLEIIAENIDTYPTTDTIKL